MKKPITIIGLDIGVSSVKRVDVTTDGKMNRLDRVTILPLADNTPETLQGVLKAMFELPKGVSKGKAKKFYKHVRISVSGPSLLIRRITITLMSRLELKGAIRFEAENHVPFPIDDCVLDFQILSENAAEKTMSVLLVAARKEFLEERLRLLADFHIYPEVIDVDIFSLINAFEILGNTPNLKSYAVLNIGYENSSFAIIQDKNLHSVRDITLGSKEIVRYLMEAKGFDQDQARLFQTAKAPETLDELKEATLKGFEPLAEELKTSISYFEEETGQTLECVMMSGGGALAHGAEEALTQLLGKTAALWDNTRKLELFKDIDHEYLKTHSSQLNVALGVALRELQQSQ